MAEGIETFELFRALKSHWETNGLGGLVNGFHVGEITGRKERPYVSVAPQIETKEMETNKGKYSMVVFEVGLVHNEFEDATGPIAKRIKEITENAELAVATGFRILKIRREDRRFEEIENYWVYWQSFEAMVSG